MYTFASSLETESPRFQQPGDFFTYLVFVCAVIMVSTPTDTTLLPGRIPVFLVHLVYLPAQSLLAEAVPGNEEDYPCVARGSIIRKIFQGSVWGVSMVGASQRRPYGLYSVGLVFGSLHSFSFHDTSAYGRLSLGRLHHLQYHGQC